MVIAGITAGEAATVVAASAALVTVLLAAATVRQARGARKEQGEAHEQEMAQRARAFDAELALKRLEQFGRIVELVGEVADLARADIAAPPPSTGVAAGTWTRVTGGLVRVEAAIVIYERLGGTVLPPEVRQFTIDSRKSGLNPMRVVPDAMGILAKLTHLAETDASLAPPEPY